MPGRMRQALKQTAGRDQLLLLKDHGLIAKRRQRCSQLLLSERTRRPQGAPPLRLMMMMEEEEAGRWRPVRVAMMAGKLQKSTVLLSQTLELTVGSWSLMGIDDGRAGVLRSSDVGT